MSAREKAIEIVAAFALFQAAPIAFVPALYAVFAFVSWQVPPSEIMLPMVRLASIFGLIMWVWFLLSKHGMNILGRSS